MVVHYKAYEILAVPLNVTYILPSFYALGITAAGFFLIIKPLFGISN